MIKMKDLLFENKQDVLANSHAAINDSIDNFIKECELAKKIESEPWVKNRLSNLQSEYKQLRQSITNNDNIVLSTSNKLFGSNHDIKKDRF